MESPITWDVWKYSTMGPGEQFVMTSGRILIPKLPAGLHMANIQCMYLLCINNGD